MPIFSVVQMYKKLSYSDFRFVGNAGKSLKAHILVKSRPLKRKAKSRKKTIQQKINPICCLL
jgi:hypothetical protein